MDLRHLALILDAGAEQAERLEDAPLQAALSAMTEVAVMLHVGDVGVWDVERDFADLSKRFA